MKVAIHHRKGSFSDRWIQYCQNNDINFKIVNAFDSDIIDQIKDCNILMWHHHHAQYRDILSAKKILFALEHAGVKVFPNFNTGWHFDDKVAQKYLLEAIGAPLVPSYIFYDKKLALNWAEETTYPKVFKLKGGAGASNVKLVKNYQEASFLIKKSFSKGFKLFDNTYILRERLRRLKNGKEGLISVFKAFVGLLVSNIFSKSQVFEQGYVYFQEFIPNNKSDIRVIVVGDKAFAIKRMVRENDFRASGSGNIKLDKVHLNEDCVKIAFEINKKLSSQCTAFDFIFDKSNKPLIVEISYGFSMKSYDLCPGYWKENLEWIEESFNPQYWIIENIIEN